MRQKTYTILGTILLFSSFLSAVGEVIPFHQSERPPHSEVYFKFSVSSPEELKKVTRVISIDNVIDLEVFAYANKDEFLEFLKLGYDYEILPNPSTLITPKMATSKDEMKEWDSYPTYETYVDMIFQFETDYPDLCVVQTIGMSVEGREIIFAKISDNVSVEEDEPEFMYTSTMHGDELVGYVLMLRLIDYLLSNYGTDPRITNLVDNVEIWINPLANPDGTYASGNQTVWGATRYNANGADLNRNFPDPEDGDHPDGNTWQPETITMMNLAEDHSFVLSSNLHSGAEVVNYPWDTWPQLHADDDWWQEVSHTYADTAQENSPPNYMDGFNDGITNGYAWYTINGGRQDYMNYFHGCREMTLELSNIKLLPESELEAHWDYNRNSFLLYMEECLYGIRGIVTDIYSNPLDATITVINHDFDNSEVFTDPDVGNYHRMIFPESYDIMVTSYGYISQIINNINVTDGNITVVDVLLEEAETISVSGTVTDGDTGNPIENAVIKLVDTPIPQVYTDENGYYIIPNVLEDTYTFRVFAEGYATIFELITVTSENNIIDFQLYQSDAISFESGEFGSDWYFDGNEDWTIVSNEAYDGNYCTKSGNISHNQTSELLINLYIINSGEISFYRKVSSESSYDYLRFYIDGSEQGSWSGDISWGEENYSVSEGNHTFKWAYEKDGSVSSGSDCAWIDYIIFPTVGIPIEEITIDYFTGWNMVGLPLEVDDGSYMTLFPNAIENTLYSYSGNYNDETEMFPGTGYWLRFDETGTTTITGQVIDEISINLTEGWNMISGISSAVSINNINDPDGVIIPNTIYGYDTNYQLANVIEPGKGYWVRANGDGEIVISSGAKASRISFVDRTKGANSLEFTNGSGKSNVLYFGVTVPEKERLSYSLPPTAPAGFDVRFMTDLRYAEESGEIQVRNETESLTISYKITTEAGEHKEWILMSENGEEPVRSGYILEGEGEIIVSSRVDRFSVGKRVIVPETYALHQNYPNPFNPVTTIRYELPEESHVTITIYDIMGRQVKELVGGELVSGYHTAIWDATDDLRQPVSAGVYFYRIKAGKYSSVKKMLLVK